MNKPPPPPQVGSSHESVVFAWPKPLAGAVATVLKLASETPMLSADVRLLLRQAQNDLERGVANCETAERRSIVSRRPYLAPMWPRKGAE